MSTDNTGDIQEEVVDDQETIDLTDNPMYQVLTAFFENDNGQNVVDAIFAVKSSIDTQTRALLTLSDKLDSLAISDEYDDAEVEVE
jgi:hypothetical protein